MVAVGDHIEVFWDGDGAFYAATVLSVSVDAAEAVVCYHQDNIKTTEAVWALRPCGAPATCTSCGTTFEREYIQRATAVAPMPVMTVGEKGAHPQMWKQHQCNNK